MSIKKLGGDGATERYALVDNNGNWLVKDAETGAVGAFDRVEDAERIVKALNHRTPPTLSPAVPERVGEGEASSNYPPASTAGQSGADDETGPTRCAACNTETPWNEDHNSRIVDVGTSSVRLVCDRMPDTQEKVAGEPCRLCAAGVCSAHQPRDGLLERIVERERDEWKTTAREYEAELSKAYRYDIAQMETMRAERDATVAEVEKLKREHCEELRDHAYAATSAKAASVLANETIAVLRVENDRLLKVAREALDAEDEEQVRQIAGCPTTRERLERMQAEIEKIKEDIAVWKEAGELWVVERKSADEALECIRNDAVVGGDPIIQRKAENIIALLNRKNI